MQYHICHYPHIFHEMVWKKNLEKLIMLDYHEVWGPNYLNFPCPCGGVLLDKIPPGFYLRGEWNFVSKYLDLDIVVATVGLQRPQANRDLLRAIAYCSMDKELPLGIQDLSESAKEIVDLLNEEVKKYAYSSLDVTWRKMYKLDSAAFKAAVEKLIPLV